MKEKPIILPGGAEMIRATLEGRKSRFTVPMVWPYVPKWHDWDYDPFYFEEGLPRYTFQNAVLGRDSDGPVKNPIGAPGQRLWVKEAFIIAPKRFADPDESCIPDADGDLRYIQYLATSPDTEAAGWYGLKTQSSVRMPRWASRITLEVVNVKVQRLLEISASDAVEEGTLEILFRPDSDPIREAAYSRGEWIPDNEDDERGDVYAGSVAAFAAFWESIHGKGSWDANPWVWAIEFRRVQP